MKRRLIISLMGAAALAASGANAADIYRPERSMKDGPVFAPVTSWTGFYIGINGGYAFDANDTAFRELDGGFGGGQAGYNFQSGNLVFGVEADIQGADLFDRGAVTVGGVAGRSKTSVDFFGTVRGRLGYAMDRTLVYATGGFAYADVEDRVHLVNGASSKAVDTLTGYAVGGGIEFKINPVWSVKGEYQYLSFDGEDLRGSAGRIRGDDIELHTVRVGLNYRFGREIEPLK